MFRTPLTSPAVIAAMLLALGFTGRPAAADDRIAVVAAENFYGDVAGQIGGAAVRVTSILSNPDQDPHLFEASASTARALADAAVVIYNGAGYDPWLPKLLAASPAGHDRRVIDVAASIGRKPGENPHVWYDPATMPKLAAALAETFARLDPARAAEFGARLATFQASAQTLAARIAAIRAAYAGTPVTATEPVFGDMAAALGLALRNQRFGLAIMNDTEPSAADAAAFQTDLRERRVKVLIYNLQATQPAAQRLRDIAVASGVPIVGVSETEPAGRRYQDWMAGQLDQLDRALAGR